MIVHFLEERQYTPQYFLLVIPVIPAKVVSVAKADTRLMGNRPGEYDDKLRSSYLMKRDLLKYGLLM